MALRNIDMNYCRLSRIDYSDSDKFEFLKKEKYLERPFAYEFYHQLRKLVEQKAVDFGGSFIQAEVDKSYQHYFPTGKIPDFIIHVPNNPLTENLAILEFKLASGQRGRNPLKAKSKRELTIYFTLDDSSDSDIITIKGVSCLARNLSQSQICAIIIRAVRMGSEKDS